MAPSFFSPLYFAFDQTTRLLISFPVHGSGGYPSNVKKPLYFPPLRVFLLLRAESALLFRKVLPWTSGFPLIDSSLRFCQLRGGLPLCPALSLDFLSDLLIGYRDSYGVFSSSHFPHGVFSEASRTAEFVVWKNAFSFLSILSRRELLGE